MSFLGRNEAKDLLHQYRDDPNGSEKAWEKSLDNRYKRNDDGDYAWSASGRRIQYTVFEGEQTEANRNAEHYLYAYHKVKENPSISSQAEFTLLTSGYAAWKAVPNVTDKFLKVATYSHEIEKDVMGQLGSMHYESKEPEYGAVPPGAPRSPYRFTPVTLDEIKSGLVGARDGYNDYYKEQEIIKDTVTQIIKDEVPTLRSARLETLLENIDSVKEVIAAEADIPMERIDIELLKYSGHIPLGDDITPSSIAGHLEQTGHFKDLAVSIMDKFYPKELDYAIENGNIIAEAIKELGAEEALKIENFSEWKDQKLDKSSIDVEQSQPSKNENQLNISSDRSDISIESSTNGTAMIIGDKPYKMDFCKVGCFDHYANSDNNLLGKLDDNGDFKVFHRNGRNLEEVATIEDFSKQNLVSLEENVRSQSRSLSRGQEQDQGREV